MKTFLIYFLILFAPFASLAKQVPDSIARTMQKQKEFQYANDPSYWAKQKPADNSLIEKLFLFFAASPALKWIGYTILALIIILVIYQVAVVNHFFFFRRSKRNKQAEEKKDDELTLEQIEERITTAIEVNDYRGAIRYLHLKTIYILDTGNKITKLKGSTNNDYLQQMRNTSGYHDFALLTRIYEYVWYGEFEPGNQQFEKIYANFNQFISRQ